MRNVTGLHHITAIAGPAQENLDFYSGILGMRLVKKSVNQDDPGTYHLFYADARGTPGSDLTFFPWSHLAPRREGHGLSVEVSLAVPSGSLMFWGQRLERYSVNTADVETRFGRATLPFVDPHGLRIALVESDDAGRRRFEPWDGSPVPVASQIRGLEGARIAERELTPTTAFLSDVLGFRRVAAEAGWERWGVGSVHHLAWCVDDEEHQLEVRERIERANRRPTPVIDRFWFKSVYFLEPGGVLFELATESPGFGVDEDPAHLGESLVLPPWLESHRAAIESMLPPLRMPVAEPIG